MYFELGEANPQGSARVSVETRASRPALEEINTRFTPVNHSSTLYYYSTDTDMMLIFIDFLFLR